MKKTLVAMLAGAVLLPASAVLAEEAAPPAAPNEADCKLTEISKALDDAMAAIKASPAYGHAGGHYAKAEKDLHATKKQLETGCKAWMKGGEKPKKK